MSVSVPEELGKSVINIAGNEGKSVSSLTAEALEFYIRDLKKKKLGYRLLDLARQGSVSGSAQELLDQGRMDDHDRS